MLHCLPYSAWADGTWADLAWCLGKTAVEQTSLPTLYSARSKLPIAWGVKMHAIAGAGRDCVVSAFFPLPPDSPESRLSQYPSFPDRPCPLIAKRY